jgi:large subunit ribosomal protein L9
MATSEVILIEAVPSLGAEADIVKVRAGYARNFLIPEGKALEVTPGALRKINHLKAKRAEREAREINEAEAVATKINKLRLNLNLETGETGKAFGSITAADLLARLVEEIKGLELPKHAIVLDRPLKESGEHQIPVKIHSEVTATLRIEIAAAPKVEQPADEEEAGTRRPRRKSAAAASSESTEA